MESAVCTLESLAQRSRQLFTLPTVAMEVLRLTSDRQVDIEKIRACIEKDPAMAAKLLRVVNSSLFCMHGVVRDLPQALTLIGLNPLRLLVLGFCLPERLLKGIAEDVLAWYWRQTLTKAVAAREFAAVASPILADEVFVAALLRDIGMLLLIQELDKPYLKLVHRSISSKKDVVEIERKAMGFDHVELSFKMMEGWGFPSSLQGREDSLDASEFDAESPGMAPRLLRIAEMATDLFTSGKTSLFPALLEESQRLLAIEESRTEIILDSIEAKVRQLADVLSLKLPENLDYQSLLVTARERLIAAADEAAEDLVQGGNRGEDKEETSPRLKKVIEDDIVRESRAAARRRDAQDKASARASAGDKTETEEPETTRAPRRDDTVVEEEPLDAQTAGSRSAGLAGLDTDALAAEVHGACGPLSVAEEPASDRTERAEPPPPGAGSGRAGAASGGRTRQAGPDGKGTSALDKSASSPEPEEPPLFKQLRTATAACHRLRCPTSLLVVDFNNDVNALGQDNATILKELVRLSCQSSCGERNIMQDFEENGRAVILLNTDRDEAVSAAHGVLESFKHAIPFCFGSNAPDVALDLGVVTLAMPSASYDPHRFVDAVKRCLYASHASGGNRIKSVDIG